MHSFIEHVQYLALANRLAFLETFYPLDSDAYDALFEAELEKLIARINEPTVRGTAAAGAISGKCPTV